jgi:hypothetical protein
VQGVLDILVSEICLKGARVVALVGQGEAAGVAQRMRGRLEIELGSDSSALDHAGKPPAVRFFGTCASGHASCLGDELVFLLRAAGADELGIF